MEFLALIEDWGYRFIANGISFTYSKLVMIKAMEMNPSHTDYLGLGCSKLGEDNPGLNSAMKGCKENLV